MFDRRDLLKGAGLAAMAATLNSTKALALDTVTLPFANGERPLVKYPQKRPMIGLTSRPPQLETPFAIFNDGPITPNNAFFVRYHLAGLPYDLDPDKFTLEVKGKVDKPLKLSLKDIRKMKATEIVAETMPAFYLVNMFNPVYITSARAICAQDTFSNNNLPEEIKVFEQNILNYHEPDYKQYFTIMQLRRMTRIIKIGLVTAIEALRDAKLEHPQAIITGTAKGSMTDTERFLHDIVDFNEGTLNPTAFIQSTYNALNGLIALHHNANGYNSTYVHRGFSLENSLMDAIMLFEENRIENALIGCFEEMTAEHYELKKKMGYWKNEAIKNIDLLNTSTEGTIAGEGTFFFTLNKSADNAIAKLSGLRMLYNADEASVKTTFNNFLAEHNLSLDQLDAVLLSYNGNSQTSHFEDAISQQLSPNTNQLVFKHLCGEFDTAAGFALWAGAKALQHQTIHPSLILKKGTSSSFKNVVIYNQYNGKEHAFYLLAKK